MSDKVMNVLGMSWRQQCKVFASVLDSKVEGFSVRSTSSINILLYLNIIIPTVMHYIKVNKVKCLTFVYLDNLNGSIGFILKAPLYKGLRSSDLINAVYYLF